jgi:hypothetical protein
VILGFWGSGCLAEMAAGVTDWLWEVTDMVKVLEAWKASSEKKKGGAR